MPRCSFHFTPPHNPTVSLGNLSSLPDTWQRIHFIHRAKSRQCWGRYLLSTGLKSMMEDEKKAVTVLCCQSTYLLSSFYGSSPGARKRQLPLYQQILAGDQGLKTQMSFSTVEHVRKLRARVGRYQSSGPPVSGLWCWPNRSIHLRRSISTCL